MSLFEIMVHGGWLMIPILISSIVVLALGIGRYLVLSRRQKELSRFLGEWEGTPSTTDPVRFAKSCEFGPDVVGKMADTFKSPELKREDAENRVESAARGELVNLEKGIGTLATLAAATPLVGFLGTVTGMIRAFMQIQNLGGNVNANVLAGGIWEALVTTAAGLAVGIIALIIHNYLAGMTRQIGRSLEKCGELTIMLLGRSNES